MADIKKINGHFLKDEKARQDIEELKEQIENIEVTGGVYDDTELRNEIEDLNNEVDEKADNLFQADMLTVSSLGGIPAGANLNNMSLQDVLTKLLFPYVAPTITSSVSYSPAGVIFEYGNVVQALTMSAEVVKKSENIIRIDFVVDNNIIKSIADNISNGGNFSHTFETPCNITSPINTSYFRVDVTDASGKTTKDNCLSSSISFVYPYYYGVLNEGIGITESVIKNLTKQVISKGNKTFSFNPNNQRAVFAYPKSYGKLKSILDPNSFEILNSFECLEVNVKCLDDTIQPYYVYINGAFSGADFKITFKL